MGLFRKRTNDEQPSKVESTPEYVYVPPIDSRVPECPNCKGTLKKAPGSKTKCPLCGLYMFVRTNPHTRERVVVTEAQAEEIDDEIARLNGTWEIRLAEKKRKEKIKADLTKSFKGKEPSKQDIEWRMLNQARAIGMKEGEGMHQLRHTCVSTLIAEGGNMKEIQGWVGHSTITETMDTYGHLFPNSMGALSKKLDKHAKQHASTPSLRVVN